MVCIDIQYTFYSQHLPAILKDFHWTFVVISRAGNTDWSVRTVTAKPHSFDTLATGERHKFPDDSFNNGIPLTPHKCASFLPQTTSSLGVDKENFMLKGPRNCLLNQNSVAGPCRSRPTSTCCTASRRSGLTSAAPSRPSSIRTRRGQSCSTSRRSWRMPRYLKTKIKNNHSIYMYIYQYLWRKSKNDCLTRYNMKIDTKIPK